MKKILFTFLISVCITYTQACPFCGCGVGNFYVGLLPEFKNKFIGVRYQYMRYHTQLADDKTQFSNDYYKTVELWSGWNIGKKWQVLTFIPYQFNVKHDDDGNSSKNGLGDISLLGNYHLLHSQKINFQSKTLHQHDVWIGAGIKLPTGKYHFDATDLEESLGDVNTQLGSGSTDILLNALYNIRLNDFGINNNVNAKLNTTNSSNYKFGNRIAASSFIYYRIASNKVNLMPNIGALYQHAAINKLSKEVVAETGGYAAFATAGVEVNYKNISLGSNIELPFAQNYAHGQTEVKFKGMVHITYTL